MDISINCIFDGSSSNFEKLAKTVNAAIPAIFQELLYQYILLHAEEYKERLSRELNTELIWKSRNENRTTKIKSLFGEQSIILPLLQVQRKDTGEKIYLTRYILGIEKFRRIPKVYREMLAKIGASLPYRGGVDSIELLTDSKVGLATIHRAVQEIGKEVRGDFKIEPADDLVLVADGTGIPTLESGKLGSEFKSVSQYTKDGRLLSVGMAVGPYKKTTGEGSWEEAFSAVRESLPADFAGTITLVTDGDPTIANAVRKLLPDGISLFLQRCIWHLFRELKHALWRDRASQRAQDKKRRKLGRKALWRLLKICLRVKEAVHKKESTRKQYISNAYRDIRYLATWCMGYGLEHACILLMRVYKEKGFDGAKNGVKCVTTSRQERMMGTLNKRINVGGAWSDKGSLNASTLRLAGYYNGWRPSILDIYDQQKERITYSIA